MNYNGRLVRVGPSHSRVQSHYCAFSCCSLHYLQSHASDNDQNTPFCNEKEELLDFAQFTQCTALKLCAQSLGKLVCVCVCVCVCFVARMHACPQLCCLLLCPAFPKCAPCVANLFSTDSMRTSGPNAILVTWALHIASTQNWRTGWKEFQGQCLTSFNKTRVCIVYIKEWPCGRAFKYLATFDVYLESLLSLRPIRTDIVCWCKWLPIPTRNNALEAWVQSVWLEERHHLWAIVYMRSWCRPELCSLKI